MVEGPTEGGGLWPGIGRAAINEVSEIMHQLAQPTVTDVEREYDKHGNVIHERTWKFSKLDALIVAGAPTFIMLFYALLERLATVGAASKEWMEEHDISSAEMVAFGPIGAYIQEKRKELIAEGLENASGVFGQLWESISNLDQKKWF